MSLTLKTTTGILWNMAELVSRRGVQVLVTLLLAYFLSPEDFGLVAMLTVFLALGTTLMDSGLKQALIRLKTPNQKDFATAFYANIFLGLVAYVLLFVSAPLIAQFYQEPRLIDLIRVVSLAILFSSFQTVQVATLSRELNFKAQLKANLPASILSGILAIVLAYLDFGVWALISQMLASVLLISIFLWMQRLWRPTLEFSKQSLVEMYHFGYKLFLSSVIDTVFNSLYIIVIAKVFSIATAGLYFFADRIKEMVVMQLVMAIQNVTYPALSTKQDDLVQLKASYKKLVKVMTFLLFPVFLFFAALSPLIFEMFLPDKWNEANLYLQLMIIASLLIPLHSINLNILKVLGRSDLFLLLEIAKKTLLALILFISIDYGIIGVLIGQIVQSVLGYFINTYFTKRLIDYTIYDQFKDFLPGLVLSGLIAGIIYFLQLELDCIPVVELISFSVLAFSLYFLGAYLLRLHAFELIKDLLEKKFKKKVDIS